MLFDSKSFGASVKANRLARGLTLAALSDELQEINPSTLHRLEAGLPCTANTMLILCKWMGVSADAFVNQTISA